MSIPTSIIICRHEKTWFDTLSMDQLTDLCRAAILPHIDKERWEMIELLSENDNSKSFASATVVSIKDMCRSRSLAVSGLKYQLVLRVLAHDSLKAFSRNNQCLLTLPLLCSQLEDAIEIGSSNAFCWLKDKMADICGGKRIQADGYEYQTPLAAFHDAESVLYVFLNIYTPNAGIDYHDSLSKAIHHLGILVVEARVFMSNSEKKAAVDCILELENFLSEYTLDENSETSLDELITLLRNDDAYYHPVGGIVPKLKQDKSYPKQIEKKKHRDDSEPTRAPLRCVKNSTAKGCPNKKSKSMAVTKKKPNPKKVITSKKEIVYKKMVAVLRTPGMDSDYVYEKLVRLMKSIARQFDYYESLRLFRSAFLALVVHFNKINHPGMDTNHNFTIAIDLLGDVVENVLGVLSIKEKEETLRWMTDLRTLTRPHDLAAIAEKPLDELIAMVKESRESETKKTRRFFLP